MSRTPISSYRFFQKLHPLSLLAQLTGRRATGCLRVFTDTVTWSIYIEEGKLTYASSSEQLFERLDACLRRLSQQVSTLHNANILQMRLMYEPRQEHESLVYSDYQAICWLVSQGYINPPQAAILIDELAKEVIESFLILKEGSYEFYRETPLDDLPKFCRLDIRLLVEHCQNQLKNRQQNNENNQIPNVAGISTSQIGLPSPQIITEERQKETPLAASDGGAETTSKASQSQSLYTVACIDDSLTVLNSIRHFLDENTFDVVMINDPVKALMQILRSKPDLILLDVEMPNLDGYELCSLLRRHSHFKHTPIIMVTGRTGFIDRAKAKMVRSSGYLTKPFTQSELLKMIFKHVE
ncbi:response regulator [Calothrix sp. 336/3]|uniref:response regulator n=1 Tax=Calothrix sp. 336/3 TaxID=1337936 RepID=UPI0004E33451|nr:response regulator [Calothrix sp. 336/3]AKG22856.1 chemotaxis protein CheY [Calothrix sp. 336/3]